MKVILLACANVFAMILDADNMLGHKNYCRVHGKCEKLLWGGLKSRRQKPPTTLSNGIALTIPTKILPPVATKQIFCENCFKTYFNFH